MIAQIRPAHLREWLTTHSDEQPLILDVREPWETHTASVQPIADAINFEVLFMPMQTIPNRIQELPQQRPMACLCHHGMRSQQVAAYLQRQGFERVVNIAGGIDAWSRELDPSVALY